MADSVLIGYGNTLRRDDALGPLTADAVSHWNCPDLQALSVPQLLPELVDVIAGARQVIFVDASLCDDVQLHSISPDTSAPSLDHTADPRRLLALTQALHGRCPEAWLVGVPAADFEFGEELSPIARHGFTKALALIQQLTGPLDVTV
jgi:hydrogenase maturation protease